MLARRVILFLAILWLPLQGVVAVAMPFCAHATGHESAPSGLQADQNHHVHVHSPATDLHPGDDPGPTKHSDFGCNGCGVCHLACAPAVPTTTTLAFASVDSIYSHLYSTLVRLFIPEQPQPPPNPTV